MNPREKIIAIHQPNFIPWAGYFFKMAKSDVFILLDDVEYTKNSVINRNRVLNSTGAGWLTIPVTATSKQLLNTVTMAEQKFRKKQLKTLQNHYARAPFFPLLFPEIEELYAQETSNLCDFSISIIEWIHGKLRLSAKLVRSSDLLSQGRGTERLCTLIEAQKGTCYISGRGGLNYQEPKEFQKRGINLLISRFTYQPYSQGREGFIPNLSIIDLLFHLGAEHGKQWLDENGRLEILKED